MHPPTNPGEVIPGLYTLITLRNILVTQRKEMDFRISTLYREPSPPAR